MAATIAVELFRERRLYSRLVFEDGGPALRARLRAGCELVPFDLSRGGTCVRAPARLLPGTQVEARLWTPHWRWQTQARVIRCEVWALCQEHGVRYRAALEFIRPMDREREAALHADLRTAAVDGAWVSSSLGHDGPGRIREAPTQHPEDGATHPCDS
jgi:hypothetical protein